jgi:hypothetical protein
VLIACRFEEKELMSSRLSRVDGAVVDQLGPSHVRIYESAAGKRGEFCIIMLFPRHPVDEALAVGLAGVGMRLGGVLQ